MTAVKAKMKRPPEPRKKIKDIKPSVNYYNPYKFNRVLHLIYRTLDGIYGWEVESFTNTKDMWHPSIDTEGERFVICDCPDFRFKKEGKAHARGITPTVNLSNYHCKHIKMGIVTLKKVGLLQDIPWPENKEN